MPLPSGTVTFLLTDVEGSTSLWERFPEAMARAVALHDQIAGRVIDEQGGLLLKARGEGDSLFAVFPTASEGVAGALALQQAFLSGDWPSETPLRVRMALHTGEADLRLGDYYGPAVNRCARLRATAHGGQVLLSAACLEAAALPPGAVTLDLGSHSLKDLLQPEHVYQLCHAALPAEFPPIRSLQAFANNLPVQLSTFIGREREMGEIKESLGRARLLTLAGPGGTGKTRLAIQVAADVLGDHADGTWLVELAPLADPALVPQTVAGALGVRPDPTRPLMEVLAEHLRTRSALLLLDNCEHLVLACAQLAAALLRQSPGLRILATSREPLGIPGEVVWRVPTLDFPARGERLDADAAERFAAVRLFVDRAALAKPGFALSDGVVDAVAKICRRLDGIPLAVELAAARVAMMTPEQIAERLEHRFRLLTGGSREGLPRQQTLRALVDWSYDLLAESERALLHRLSVFAGGWTLEAAESVCAGGEVEDWEIVDLLGRLVDKSLVVASERDGSQRYRLLETMRQYAQEKLQEAGEADDVRARHAAHYLGLAQQASRLLAAGGADVAKADAVLAADLDNVRTGMDFAARQNDAASTVEYAKALFGYLRQHSLYAECDVRLQAAEAAARGCGDRASVARLLNQRGLAAWERYDLETARRLFDESCAISRELGEQDRVLVSLVNQGNVAWGRGDLDDASQLWQEAIVLGRQIGQTRYEGLLRTSLGILAAERGDLEEAERHFAASLATHRGAGDEMGTAFALYNSSEVHRRRGELDRALDLLDEGRQLFDRLGHTRGVALAQVRSALVLLEAGRAADAQDQAEEGLRTADETGDRACRMYALAVMARLATAAGDPARARELLRGSFDIARAVGDRRHAAEVLYHAGEALAAEGRLEDAYVAVAVARREYAARGMADAAVAAARLADLASRLPPGVPGRLDEPVCALSVDDAFRRACAPG